MQDSPLIVLTTFPDEPSALTAARRLVKGKLAACVNVLPQMTSVYEWDKEIQTGREHLLFIKTTETRYPQVEAALREQHPYELPEIVATPITHGLGDYLSWINQQTTSTA